MRKEDKEDECLGSHPSWTKAPANFPLRNFDLPVFAPPRIRWSNDCLKGGVDSAAIVFGTCCVEENYTLTHTETNLLNDPTIATLRNSGINMHRGCMSGITTV